MEPQRPKNTRFVELDGLRGVAALAVVVAHVTGNYDTKYPGDPAWLPNLWWGTFGVQLFFFISGFVILMTARRSRRPSDFVISRVSRLYPVYWIALTMAIIISIVFAVPHTQIGWPARLMNYTMVQRLLMFPNVDEVYWTLAIEMQFYILIFLLLVVLKGRLTDRAALIFGGCWLALSLVTATIFGGQSRGIGPQFVAGPYKVLFNLLITEWGPFFVTGMFAFLARTHRRYRPAAFSAAAIAVAVSGLMHNLQTLLIVAVIAAAFLAVALRERTAVLRLRPIQFYGRISYSLYICHLVTSVALIHLLIPAVGRPAATITAVIVVTLYAMALNRVGEQWASRRFRVLLQKARDRMLGASMPAFGGGATAAPGASPSTQNRMK